MSVCDSSGMLLQKGPHGFVKFVMSPCQVITVQSARSVRLSYFSVKLASGLGTGFGPVVVILVTGVD